jgi:hypothetical protein
MPLSIFMREVGSGRRAGKVALCSPLHSPLRAYCAISPPNRLLPTAASAATKKPCYRKYCLQTLVAALDRELEHRRDVAMAFDEAIDQALADEERLASVIFVSHPIARAIRFPTSAARLPLQILGAGFNHSMPASSGFEPGFEGVQTVLAGREVGIGHDRGFRMQRLGGRHAQSVASRPHAELRAHEVRREIGDEGRAGIHDHRELVASGNDRRRGDGVGRIDPACQRVHFVLGE